MEKPARYMTKKAPISETGITIHGTSVTPVAQEEENDDDNQYKGLIHRLLHLVDRSADKLGIVKTVVVMNVFGKVFLHLLHAVIYGVGYFNVVGTRLRNYYDTYHGHTVHLHVAFDVGRSQLGITDVAEAYYLSILFL